MLNTRQLERIIRGCANHRRIEIMVLLQKQPELSVAELATELDINYKTASEHIRRLAIPGLIMKRSAGASVRHRLTNRGLVILKFLRTLEYQKLGYGELLECFRNLARERRWRK